MEQRPGHGGQQQPQQRDQGEARVHLEQDAVLVEIDAIALPAFLQLHVRIHGPADVAVEERLEVAPRAAQILVGRMRILVGIDKPVMPPMGGDPPDQRAMPAHGAGHREHPLQARAGLEGAVREAAMEPDLDPHHREQIHRQAHRQLEPAHPPIRKQQQHGDHQPADRQGHEQAPQDIVVLAQPQVVLPQHDGLFDHASLPARSQPC